MDLTTEYLGLKLKNPLLPSSSPLSRELDNAKRLEDAEASGLVIYSLFEEEILKEEEEIARLMEFQDIGHGEAASFIPDHFEQLTKLENYLEHIQNLKQSLEIPIIGSLNCITDSGWAAHAKEIEMAGADALELNIYHIPATIEQTAKETEDFYLKIVKQLSAAVSIPLTVKLSFQFTAPLNFVHKLKKAGADGAVLFNRFYQPDLNLNNLQLNHQLNLSQSYEALLRMHWIALIKDKVDLSLAATGGLHDAQEVIKLLLVGADITQMASSLLINGPEHLIKVKKELIEWMEQNKYSAVEQLKGSFSQQRSPDPWVFERTNYLEMLGKNYQIVLE